MLVEKAGNFSNVRRNMALASAIKLPTLFWTFISDVGWLDKAQMLKPLGFPHSFPWVGFMWIPLHFKYIHNCNEIQKNVLNWQ